MKVVNIIIEKSKIMKKIHPPHKVSARSLIRINESGLTRKLVKFGITGLLTCGILHVLSVG